MLKLKRIMMCVFVGTLLGALAATAEGWALDARTAGDATDGAGALVSMAAAWNAALARTGD